jgi:hypothetical protein
MNNPYVPEWAPPEPFYSGKDDETTLPEGMDHPNRPDAPERFSPR